MANTSSVELLVPIWQKVLQRPSVHEDDNFFELGGNPASAASLVVEIAEVCGRHLSPVSIYFAPTIKTLAAVLEQPLPPHIPPVLLLKAGTQDPPIFIAHGLGDTVFDLFPLVGKINSTHSIYGMQARGIDGVDEPFSSVEAMAQFHIGAIKQLQPHGPYFLIGYSLGGLVSLEIAQRLSADGEKIALLALVDSYPDRNQLAPLQRLLLFLRLAKRRSWWQRKSTLGSSQSRISKESSQNAHQFAEGNAIMERMRSSAHVALRSYRPQFYRGKVKFVKAEVSTDFPDNPIVVWSHLAETFEMETIPGDHWSMLTAQFEQLGSTLTRYVNEAETRDLR